MITGADVFQLDIIWISGDTVVDVTANVPPPPKPDTPDDQLSSYKPSGPASRVLEVPAGWAARHGVQPGDPVRLLK